MAVIDHLTTIFNFKGDLTTLNRIKRRVAQVKQDMSTLATEAGKVGTALTTAAAAPLATFATVEENLAKMRGLVGVSQEQLDEWEEDIKDISKTTGESMADITDALFFITSAGFEGETAMDILLISAKAAATGLGEQKDIADLLTSAMSVYGEEALSAAEAGDQLVASIREGKLEPEEMATAMAGVLPFAAEMGVEFGEVAGAMAAMSTQGIKARRGGVALRSILSKLIKPSEGAKKVLEEYGLSIEDVRKVVEEEGLQKGLETLVTAFDGNKEALGAFFEDNQALLGVLALTGEAAEKNAEIIDNVTNANGDLDEAFKILQETLKAKLQQALSNFKIILFDIGERLAPMAKEILDMSAAVLEWYENLGEGPKEFIASILALGPLLLGIAGSLWVATALAKPLAPAFRLISGALFPLKALMGALWKLMLANPLLALLTAVLAAIIYWDELNELFKKAKQWFLDLLAEWGVPIDDIFGWIGEKWQGVLDTISNIDWSGVGTAMGETMRGLVTGAIKKFTEFWKSLWSNDTNAEGVKTGFLGAFKGLAKGLVDLLLVGWTAYAKVLIAFFEALFGFEEGSIGEAIKGAWKKIMDLFAVPVMGILDWIAGLFGFEEGGIGALIQAHWDTILAIFNNPVGTLFDWIGEVWNKLMAKLISYVPGPLRSLFGLDDADASEAGAATSETFAEGLEGNSDATDEAAEGWGGKIMSWLPGSDADRGPLSQLTASGKALVETFADGIRQGSGLAGDAMMESLSDLATFEFPIASNIELPQSREPTEESRQLSVTIEKIEVMTQATDANEIAQRLSAPLEESIRRAVESADSRILV